MGDNNIKRSVLVTMAIIALSGCSTDPQYWNHLQRNQLADQWTGYAQFQLCLMDHGIAPAPWFNCIRNAPASRPLGITETPLSMVELAEDPSCTTSEQKPIIEHCVLEVEAAGQAATHTTTCSEFLGTVTCTSQ